jgi:hypothetical protein
MSVLSEKNYASNSLEMLILIKTENEFCSCVSDIVKLAW